MKITFAGVGEAFDEHLRNTSMLVSDDSGERQILLDCGFTAPHDFWRVSLAPMDLDAVWISHFHGDHFFGLPLLLLRYWEQGREKPLTVIGQEGIEGIIRSTMDLAYPGFLSRIQYTLNFQEAYPGKDIDLVSFRWSFAETSHSRPCLAVRMDTEGDSIFYSGDGSPTDGTAALAEKCDIIVHEAFGLEGLQPGHGSVELSIEFATRARARALALVHMNRDVRRTRGSEIRKMLSELRSINAFLPEPGDHFDL